MKALLIYLILGGLMLIIILQGALFASTGLQANRQQKQFSELNQKYDQLQNYISSTQKMITKINSFIDEPIPSDDSSTPSSDPNDLLSPENLNKTLGQ